MLVSVFNETQSSVNINTFEDLLPYYPKHSGVRFNYVISTSNRTSNSDEITSPLDRMALKAIRAQSKLIVTTGLTARIEKLRASRFADLLVITNQERINFPALETNSSQKVLVTTTTLDSVNDNAQAIGKVTVELTDWFLREVASKYESIVLETGLTTAKFFAKADLINEVCLTVTGADLETASQLAREFLENLGVQTSLVQRIDYLDTHMFRFSVV
jgi:riboflavin biosynthesis pyrimidine reductase